MSIEQLPPMLGRNGWDDPITGPQLLAMEMENIDPYEGGIGMKRHGIAKSAVSDVSLLTDPVDGFGDSSIVLTGDEQLASTNETQSPTPELWMLGSSNLLHVLSAGVSSSIAKQWDYALTMSSAAADIAQMNGVGVNSKFVVFGNSTVNRIQATRQVTSDPLTSGTVLGIVGLKAPGAATCGNTGAGAYAATLRYYRVSMAFYSGSTKLRESNLGASVAFTPSGLGTAVRITQPTPVSEGETHWNIYVSLNNAVYYFLASVAIATTTYDDSTVTTLYSAGALAPIEGSQYPFPSCKFPLYAFNRLMAFGRWETSAGDSIQTRDGHVYFSPVRGSSDMDVEETIKSTIDEKGFIPLEENSSGLDRAFCGPMEGGVWAFKDRGVYRVSPTGVASSPFRSLLVTREHGAVSNKSTFTGLDEIGRPCIYFLDPVKGPCRIGANGPEWIGKDVADIWETVNLAATVLTAHGHYDSGRNQVRFWIATGSSNRPDRVIMLSLSEFGKPEALRGGWHTWTGKLAQAMSSVLHNVNLTKVSAKVPYMMIPITTGLTVPRTQPPYLYHLPYTGLGVEIAANSSDFTVTVRSKAYKNLGLFQGISKVFLLADALASGSVRVDILGNTGSPSASQIIGLDAVASESHVFRYVDGLTISQVWTWQIVIGRSTDVGQFNLLAVYVERADQGPAYG